MRLLSFNPYRCLDIPGVTYLKPEEIFRHQEALRAADWVLYPEYWQVNSLVYGLKRRIFPSPASYHLGHDKVEMTRALWSVCQAHVPETLILGRGETSVEAVRERFDFPFVAKEVRNSMGRGVFLVEEPAQLRDYVARNEVLYLQEYLPIDRDLRVVWVGDRVVAAYWRIGADGAFHHNVAQGGTVSFEEVPEAALALVQRVATELGINHAGFDLAVVDGHCYFLEFNVLFGNQALAARGIRLGAHILDYLERMDRPPREPDRPLPLAS